MPEAIKTPAIKQNRASGEDGADDPPGQIRLPNKKCLDEQHHIKTTGGQHQNADPFSPFCPPVGSDGVAHHAKRNASQCATCQQRPKVQHSPIAPPTERGQHDGTAQHRPEERQEQENGARNRCSVLRDFSELLLEPGGFANSRNGQSKSLLFVATRTHPLLDLLAKMTSQLRQRHGSLNAGGEHLFPPVRDGLFEVKHIAPFLIRPRRNEPATIVRDVWPSPFCRPV